MARTLSWSSRYSRRLSSGSIEIAHRFSATLTSLKPTSPFLKTREAFSWDATSQTIVRLPCWAAARPSAIEIVDLPTPPLPVTNTSLLSKRPGMSWQFCQCHPLGGVAGAWLDQSRPQAAAHTETRLATPRCDETCRRGGGN